jgi:uncharacterized membrane protein
MMKRLRRYFLAGLVVVLPIFASVWLLVFLFFALTSVTPRLVEIVFKAVEIPWLPNLVFRLLVLIAFVTLVTLLGAFATRTIGKRITTAFQRLLERIPLFNRIYTALKQILHALFMFDSGEVGFKRVALVEYPRKGIYTVAFVTSETDLRLATYVRALGRATRTADVPGARHYINVFVPTTPNPTSGFFLVLPARAVKMLDITVEEALRLIISGGAVTLDQVAKEERDGPGTDSPSA